MIATAMESINYRHLFYFWTVATEGSVSRACEKLHLAQPTVSGQLQTLEHSLGEKLFQKSGRSIALTEVGRVVYRYADEIFSLGRELANTVRGRPIGRPLRLFVGVADALPKLIAFQLIEPALHSPDSVQVVVYEDKPERLLAEMAVHALDIVLSDIPFSTIGGIRTFNHLLGDSGVSVFAIPELAKKYRKGFPQSLDGAPFLLPTGNTALRRSLEQWFESEKIYPSIRAEIDDSALLKTFGHAGIGLFVAPTVVEATVQSQYGVRVVGRIDSIRAQFYAISAERKVTHPAVATILENARKRLFD